MDIQTLFGVKDKIVLVTGGGRGIGLMIAKAYVANGAKVYISSRSKEVCDKVASQLNKEGPGQCISVPADLQHLEQVKNLAQEIERREGKLHILVNNAGANWGAPLSSYPDEAFEKVMNLNLKRVFSLTQALIPLLEKTASQDDPARIINIGSVDGIRVPALETFAYSASKAALHHMTKVLAHHLGPQFITVNAIAPGPFESKMMNATLEKFRDSIEGSNPLKRIGRPSDIGGTCIYLSSRAGSYTNGAIITNDGGAVITAKL
ncbi:short chain dehydrogenase/reductase family [Basidiobolus meristosporus CBS 931.73]|uniref:Short chain dehydrogenase/reductase family n=1 Tax=Basidiobolus meristosporus CBS 931.73 TaxID=1314790 RepID=A0A1Y1Z8G7_9FUNG|nr:short chain dehydrogenase/reductase family [Basidiobolus meristosporus CBS 931.73]|eukprot:ORY06562.1 short chain dehydrogenase/reductase family [Basidiobolus meristosporus CBS 931.73]